MPFLCEEGKKFLPVGGRMVNNLAENKDEAQSIGSENKQIKWQQC